MKIWHSDRLSKPLTPEAEEERRKELEDIKFRPSDYLVMIGTAFVHVFLPVVLILLVIVLIAMLVFRLF